MKREVNGLLIVDKPEELTSLEVVKEVRHRFRIKKAGHIGTLDPFATGVLPIALNEGTKLIPFLKDEPKEYEAVLKLGEETSTDDWTGKVTFRKPWEEVNPEVIHSVFRTFVGKIHQIPSMFSAIKVNGVPLYRLARKGIEIERKAREVEIFSIHIKAIDLPQICFRISCSKGTYIRTLGRDIGRKIGCGAHLLHLRRLRSGSFDLDQAISWETLRHLSHGEDLSPWLISLKEALPYFPEVIGNEQLVKKVRFGQEMVVGDLSTMVLPAFEKGQWLKMSSAEEGLVAILKSEFKEEDLSRTDPDQVAFRPLRIFHTKRQYSQEGHI